MKNVLFAIALLFQLTYAWAQNQPLAKPAILEGKLCLNHLQACYNSQ